MVSLDTSAVQRLSAAAQRYQHEVHPVLRGKSQRGTNADCRGQGEHQQLKLPSRSTNEVHHSRLHRYAAVELGVGAEERAAGAFASEQHRHVGDCGGLGGRITSAIHASDSKHKTGRIRVSLFN